MPVSLVHNYILKIVKCYSYVIIAPTVSEMVLNQFTSVHFIRVTPVKNKISDREIDRSIVRGRVFEAVCSSGCG